MPHLGCPPASADTASHSCSTGKGSAETSGFLTHPGGVGTSCSSPLCCCVYSPPLPHDVSFPHLKWEVGTVGFLLLALPSTYLAFLSPLYPPLLPAGSWDGKGPDRILPQSHHTHCPPQSLSQLPKGLGPDHGRDFLYF